MTVNNNYIRCKFYLSLFQRANRGTKHGIGEAEAIAACEGGGRAQSNRSRSHTDSENEETREGDTNITRKIG